jgi:hypothetical protein
MFLEVYCKPIDSLTGIARQKKNAVEIRSLTMSLSAVLYNHTYSSVKGSTLKTDQHLRDALSHKVAMLDG